ncbi:unnamed protein product [Ilex paraguariensis]|uniref:Disease resistance R13L4/SHOC-2-like LRR domain-containing protein n=1 Tax=Ilex paraguariensis TaxID=185542 RepID=A0ABC8SUP3_9AQUA
MGTPTTVLVVLFSILLIQVLEFSYSIASHSNVRCIEIEEKGLVKFRENLTDESNRLSSKTCLGGGINPSLFNLKHLSHLDLSMDNFSGTQIPKFLGSLQNLSFDSTIPLWLSNIPGLLRLHLDDNRFQGPIPDTLGRLYSLTHIGLSDNSFNTSMPSSLGNLSSLVHLDLSVNEFQGSLQTTIKNLCRLRVLDLSKNSFSDEIPRAERGPFGCHKNLESLLLSSNSFHVPIHMSIGRLSRLRELDVSKNLLNGSIPSILGQLSKLEMLDVSANHLAGMVYEYHFTKLTKLNRLSMSFHFLALNVSSQWIPPFQLQAIKLASYNLGPLFSSWLQTQTHVILLFMSNASVSDTIPDWFENVYSRIPYLDLSMNRISGKLPKFVAS